MSLRTGSTPAVAVLASSIASLLSGQALASDQVHATLPTVVVSATRSEETLSSLPASVTVVEREELEAQASTARTLAEMLGKVVPGLALGVGSPTNTSQTLRGRGLLVLIDGIPQTTIRNASRDLYTIDPAAVERIEVVRGASAMYGQGGAGGVINIVTRAPAPGEASYRTTVGVSSSLTHVDDSLGGRLRQYASARHGDLYYVVSGAVEHIGGAFDADGERIAPDPSQGDLYDTGSVNLLAKLGWTRDDQRLELVANRFRSRQDTDHVSDPAVNAFPPGSVPARALEGLELARQGETDNDLLSLGYRNADLGGSAVDAQLYHRDYYTRFFPFDGRPFAAWNSIAQSYVVSEVTGARLSIDTPLLSGPAQWVSLTWGADVSEETTAQRATTFDPETYDASGGLVFVPIDDRGLVPPLRHRQAGAFAQLEWAPSERWTIRGGARHERVELHVDDFVTLGQRYGIDGGTVDYSSTVANIGAVFDATDHVQLFAAYSEGFSLPDIGLILRGASPGFDVSRSNLEPIEVRNHEIGLRGDWEDVRGTLSLFYSDSDLGVTSNGISANVVRAPERTYGLELAVDADITDTLSAGGSFTWIEGENEPRRDGDHVALNGWRIPPPKLVAYLDHATSGGWRNRLQLVHSGDRDRAADDGVGYGGRAVDSFTVVDLLSTVEVGPGELAIGVENLFNADYHNVYAQLLVNGRNETHFKAPGRTLRLDYTIEY